MTSAAGSPGDSRYGVGFLVVGSPRSGTTLVQRLACEIPGVGMPAETHFFSQFVTGLLERRSFPLEGPALTEEIGRFGSLDSARGLAVDATGVVKALGGVCRSPFDLFDALVRQLAGPAEIWGEKTPEHLLWWRPLSQCAPGLRFVVVVRDPRAVVASNLGMPWRDDGRIPAWGENVHLAFAEMWACVQDQVRLMESELGGDRVLRLRYEDVATDPDGARGRIARFLGRPPVTETVAAPEGIVLPWEPWKSAALGPVVTENFDAWRRSLGDRRAHEVAAVCRGGMTRYGYGDDAPSALRAKVTLARLGPRQLARTLRYRRAYRGYVTAIAGRRL
ncbi:MAG TPA: sulfotransferase [Acidimicrobiales bacterium]|nr:sulfotransferase [Acidimicrobiales bacterium]